MKEIKDGTSNTLMLGERYVPANSNLGSIGHGAWIGVPDCTRASGLAMSLGDTSIRMNSGAYSRAETTGFGSAHRGGAHFMFADGSVHFLSQQIDLPIYRDQSTIDDRRDP